jgi:uncharacterized protein (TIGR02246 family)
MEHDERAVSEVIDNFRAAGRAGDLDAFMDNFSEDAIVMLSNRREDADKSAIRNFFHFLEDECFDQEITKDEIQVMGDWAFARVTFDGYRRPKTGAGEPRRVLSRHLMILKRSKDGVWKLHRDIWIRPPQ